MIEYYLIVLLLEKMVTSMNIEIRFITSCIGSTEIYSYHHITGKIVIKFYNNNKVGALWNAFYTLYKGGFFENASVTIYESYQFVDLVSIMSVTLCSSNQLCLGIKSINVIPLDSATVQPVQQTIEEKNEQPIDQNVGHPTEKIDQYYRMTAEILSTKNISIPNLRDLTPKSVTRQINWLRSILGMDVLSLTEQTSLKVLERLRKEYKF